MHLEVIEEKSKDIFFKLGKFKNFYLAGGTALAIQIGHRISKDFDLFSISKLDDNLIKNIEKVFGDYKIKFIIKTQDQLTIKVDNTFLTFLYYPFKPILKLVKFKDIKILCVKEIGAVKAYTIGRRANFKDYVDLYFIIKEKYASLKEIIKLSKEKYKDLFNARLFLEQLIYFKDIKPIRVKIIRGKINKKNIESFFVEEIKKLKESHFI
ncbi:MAG: nucleotidyl transferase AbiEii/AbiGii toxin family protein [Minisyncoccia bacterium]